MNRIILKETPNKNILILKEPANERKLILKEFGIFITGSENNNISGGNPYEQGTITEPNPLNLFFGSIINDAGFLDNGSIK